LTPTSSSSAKLRSCSKPKSRGRSSSLAYVTESGSQMTAVHVFADAESMDRHFEGSDERSKAAYEFLEPDGWEIYGRPSEDVVDSMRQAAATSGVMLTLQRDYVAGFLRPTSG
jgi:hypothetical protein